MNIGRRAGSGLIPPSRRFSSAPINSLPRASGRSVAKGKKPALPPAVPPSPYMPIEDWRKVAYPFEKRCVEGIRRLIVRVERQRHEAYGFEPIFTLERLTLREFRCLRWSSQTLGMEIRFETVDYSPKSMGSADEFRTYSLQVTIRSRPDRDGCEVPFAENSP